MTRAPFLTALFLALPAAVQAAETPQDCTADLAAITPLIAQITGNAPDLPAIAAI